MISSNVQNSSVSSMLQLFVQHKQGLQNDQSSDTGAPGVAGSGGHNHLTASQGLGDGVMVVLLSTQQIETSTTQVANSAAESASPYEQGSFQARFKALSQALDAGDMEASKQAMAAVAALNSGENGVTYDSIGVPKEVQNALQAIKLQLQSYDVARAQQHMMSMIENVNQTSAILNGQA